MVNFQLEWKATILLKYDWFFVQSLSDFKYVFSPGKFIILKEWRILQLQFNF